MSFQVLLFYKYVTIEDPKAFADHFRARAAELGFRGRILISEEGINATLEGQTEKTEFFINELRQDPRFSDIKFKKSVGDGKTFPKLLVKVRNEIVGTRFSLAEADPRVRTAPHLAPEQLRSMYEANEDFVIIDMRNSFEFASGHFKNSIDPGMRASRDLEKAVLKLEAYKDKKIVTVCTGGIRCEKMSAYLLNKGFTDVYQLEDGMHAYMEKYPGKDFLGTLYTFDDRVMMDFGGDREIVGVCRLCKEKTERYLNCQNDDCHLHILVCAACAPTEKEVFCSMTCRMATSVFGWRKRVETAVLPSKAERVILKRRILKRYNRLAWGIRRLKRSFVS